MAEIALTERQKEAVIDAIESGLQEAIATLKKACPELGDYIIRALIFKYFNDAITFNGISLDSDLNAIREIPAPQSKSK